MKTSSKTQGVVLALVGLVILSQGCSSTHGNASKLNLVDALKSTVRLVSGARSHGPSRADGVWADYSPYFRDGNESVINFGLPGPAANGFMNDAGLIGLTKNQSPTDFDHGYRFDPRTQTSTLLPPSRDPTELNVLIQGINVAGDVLGYSFTDFASPDYHERVGIFFQTFFFETLNTSTLVFNDRDEIVITNSSDGEGYLVPAPGTRLDLASLTSNVPTMVARQCC